MDEFTNWDIISSLLLAMRWTVLLSLIAFAGGTLITIVLLLLRLTCGKTVNLLVSAHVNLSRARRSSCSSSSSSSLSRFWVSR